MKIHHVTLIVVIAIALYVGVNMNDVDATKDKRLSSFESVANMEQTEGEKDHHKNEFKKFYENMYASIQHFNEIDESTTNLAEQNPSKNQQYEFFSNAKQVMEEGQKLPLSKLVPTGFTKTQTKIMDETTSELYHGYQYRKFGYDFYLKYLETANPKDYSTSMEWMDSSNASLQVVIINLEALRLELGYDDIEPK